MSGKFAAGKRAGQLSFPTTSVFRPAPRTAGNRFPPVPNVIPRQTKGISLTQCEFKDTGATKMDVPDKAKKKLS
jgi:hypothetical protein